MWYEIKVHYSRQSVENGFGKVRETYIVDGVSCSDVERRVIERVQSLASDTVEVSDCKRVKFYDVMPNTVGDYWYKARVEMITEDNEGKEKRKAVTILVEAADMESAFSYLDKQLSAVDCEIISIAKSSVVEVVDGVN